MVIVHSVNNVRRTCLSCRCTTTVEPPIGEGSASVATCLSPAAFSSSAFSALGASLLLATPVRTPSPVEARQGEPLRTGPPAAAASSSAASQVWRAPNVEPVVPTLTLLQ